jgi:hypothetical protein
MTHFIQDHVGTMDLDILAAEVHNELVGQVNTAGVDVRTVKEHITTHTLHPTVRLGVTLRHLLDLSDQVRGDLRKVDANGQSMGLDPKMIDAYIRLQGQILNVYKSESNRMMFGTQHT